MPIFLSYYRKENENEFSIVKHKKSDNTNSAINSLNEKIWKKSSTVNINSKEDEERQINNSSYNNAKIKKKMSVTNIVVDKHNNMSNMNNMNNMNGSPFLVVNRKIAVSPPKIRTRGKLYFYYYYI